MTVQTRWIAVATYRTDQGIKPEVWFVDEIEELQQKIEGGPNWGGLEHIIIHYNLGDSKKTVEEADAE